MFRMLRLLLASIVIAAFTSVTSAGDGSEWSIVRASGQIWIRAGGAETVSLGDTRTILPGTTLATSANGRALLQRGEETMLVGPGTIIQLPADSSRLYTTVIELTGIVEFDVEKRNVKHFAVKTPYLAAVVKGTHFAVEANADSGSVAVERGIVEVEALSTGQKVDLLPGQRAEVTADGLAVFEKGDRADAGAGGVTTASVAPAGSGLASLSSDDDGLGVGIGGSNGINASVGGGSGIGVSVGGSNGVSVGVGGGNGVSIGVGGLHVGIGAP